MAYTLKQLNMDGRGYRNYRVFAMAPTTEPVYHLDKIVSAIPSYWPAVTDVPCPRDCGGTIRWAEAGYVPGYRVCDHCHRHFVARGSADAPTLVLTGRVSRYR